MNRVLDVTGEDREAAIEEAAAALRDGKLVVMPTDTVYGLAADAFSPEGTAAVFAAKHRSRRFPLPVLIRSPKQLPGLCTSVPAAADRLMAAYWPGPLTLVVRSEPNLMWDLGEAEGTVSVRMPLDEVALAVIRAVGPLAVTSANLAGQPPPTSIRAAQRHLGTTVDVYLEAGERRQVRASTIVDLTREQPHILRSGALDDDEVLEVAKGLRDPMDVTPLDPTPSDEASDDRGVPPAAGEGPARASAERDDPEPTT